MALLKIYTDEDAAREHLESLNWPDGPICPHCGTVNEATKLEGNSTRPGVYKCRPCQKPFSVTVGTVFERSKIKLNVWVRAVDLYTASKKGFSAHQLHRTLGVTYKTAWFMAHRIREAMRDLELPPLGGHGKTVESDETFIASQLMTDEAPHYKQVGREFKGGHDAVNHGKDEYVRYDAEKMISTNTVEGYYSIFKRGMKGVYQHCSEKHLHRYLAEFDFRYSNRVKLGVTDAMRSDKALQGIVGKRLTYRWPRKTEIN